MKFIQICLMVLFTFIASSVEAGAPKRALRKARTIHGVDVPKGYCGYSSEKEKCAEQPNGACRAAFNGQGGLTEGQAKAVQEIASLFGTDGYHFALHMDNCFRYKDTSSCNVDKNNFCEWIDLTPDLIEMKEIPKALEAGAPATVNPK